jgi:hypothetical protein
MGHRHGDVLPSRPLHQFGQLRVAFHGSRRRPKIAEQQPLTVESGAREPLQQRLGRGW